MMTFILLEQAAASPARSASRPLKMVLSCLVALLLFLYCGAVLRYMDPAAAPLDTGVLSLPLLAILILLVFIAISLWLLGLIWPVFRKFPLTHFENQFKSLDPCQKICCYLAAFFLLLYAFIGCLHAIM